LTFTAREFPKIQVTNARGSGSSWSDVQKGIAASPHACERQQETRAIAARPVVQHAREQGAQARADGQPAFQVEMSAAATPAPQCDIAQVQFRPIRMRRGKEGGISRTACCCTTFTHGKPTGERAIARSSTTVQHANSGTSSYSRQRHEWCGGVP
jgi:hypothetical protein